jgi:hypothetical protein
MNHVPPSSGEKKASHEDLSELKMDDRMGAAAAVASKYVCRTSLIRELASKSYKIFIEIDFDVQWLNFFKSFAVNLPSCIEDEVRIAEAQKSPAFPANGLRRMKHDVVHKKKTVNQVNSPKRTGLAEDDAMRATKVIFCLQFLRFKFRNDES